MKHALYWFFPKLMTGQDVGGSKEKSQSNYVDFNLILHLAVFASRRNYNYEKIVFQRTTIENYVKIQKSQCHIELQ